MLIFVTDAVMLHKIAEHSRSMDRSVPHRDDVQLLLGGQHLLVACIDPEIGIDGGVLGFERRTDLLCAGLGRACNTQPRPNASNEFISDDPGPLKMRNVS